MMLSKYGYGRSSAAELETVRQSLRRICERALGYGIMDASVIQGKRNEEEQGYFFITGKSKVQWPDSKHNVINPTDKAAAVDIAPYINGACSWRKDHCCVWAGLMLAAAKEEGAKLRWGGCWSGDPEDIGNQAFEDLCHFEVVD